MAQVSEEATRRTLCCSMRPITSPATHEAFILTVSLPSLKRSQLPSATAGTSGYGTGIGGGNTQDPVQQPEIYDIPSDTWSGPLAAASHPRLYHSTALLLPTGEVTCPIAYCCPVARRVDRQLAVLTQHRGCQDCHQAAALALLVVHIQASRLKLPPSRYRGNSASLVDQLTNPQRSPGCPSSAECHATPGFRMFQV